MNLLPQNIEWQQVLQSLLEQNELGVAVQSAEGSFVFKNKAYEVLERQACSELFAIIKTPIVVSDTNQIPKDVHSITCSNQQQLRLQRTHIDLVPQESNGILRSEVNADGAYEGKHARNEYALLLLLEDVSDVAQFKKRAQEAESRYELASRSTNDGLWDWDLGTDEIFLSERWLHMLGYSETDFRYTLPDWLNIIHPQDKKNFSVQINNYLKYKPDNRFNLEYRIADKNGEYRWMYIQGILICDDTGKPVRFTGAHTDITEKKRMEQQLIHDSLHDGLTDLANRLLFRENLQTALQKRAEGLLQTFAIIHFDIDQFQTVNNGMGHLFGDHVLITVAQRIRKMVTSTDTVARLGADEFALLLEAGHTRESINFFATKLQERISTPIQANSQEVVITGSMGIVLVDHDHKLVTDILVDAATALHKARGMGGSKWVVFSKDMRAQAQQRIQMENRLRAAIENEDILVYFQPIYSTQQKRIIGFEALARWMNKETEKLIFPNEFIPLAEETGLILPLGEYVLRKSAQACKKWNTDSSKPIFVSINLSAKQFRQPDIHLTVAKVLESTQLSPDLLHVEITESQVMEHALRTIEILKNMKNLGVHISIDDFGTGYSSLAYLKRFPIDTIKIDRVFIHELPQNTDDVEIAKAIVALSKSLHLQITAEGVETIEQMQFLEKESVDNLQGFYFSPAIAESEVPVYLEHF
jgi:diguanylate cyclase (GGDEF)-like protein/PAS domain S-box-containing protein